MIRKARKQHICHACNRLIQPGDKYDVERLRLPRYDFDKYDDEIQVGIEYMTFKTCGSCLERFEKEQQEISNLLSEKDANANL